MARLLEADGLQLKVVRATLFAALLGKSPWGESLLFVVDRGCS
jgi:hypothetical protein